MQFCEKCYDLMTVHAFDKKKELYNFCRNCKSLSKRDYSLPVVKKNMFVEQKSELRDQDAQEYKHLVHDPSIQRVFTENFQKGDDEDSVMNDVSHNNIVCKYCKGADISVTQLRGKGENVRFQIILHCNTDGCGKTWLSI